MHSALIWKKDQIAQMNLQIIGRWKVNFNQDELNQQESLPFDPVL